jgi:hypothetical protein
VDRSTWCSALGLRGLGEPQLLGLGQLGRSSDCLFGALRYLDLTLPIQLYGQFLKRNQNRCSVRFIFLSVHSRSGPVCARSFPGTIRVFPSFSLRMGKIPDTQFLNPNYPNPDPKYPNPNYPITISDSDCKNPKLVWVIRVMFSGTQTTRITRNISNICSSIPNMKT